jgi:hypothetical protein
VDVEAVNPAGRGRTHCNLVLCAAIAQVTMQERERPFTAKTARDKWGRHG